MNLPRILIVESNPPDLIAAQGYRTADQFKPAFDALEPSADCHVAEPYAKNFETCSLGRFDGLVFTVSGVNWGVDAKEAAPLRITMEQFFETDLPVWGSCNRMQLASVVLGGTVRSSLNGLKVGVAKGTRKTDAEKSHPTLQGSAEVFVMPCINRNEVDRLPIGAVHLEENDHSSIQFFAYRAVGIDFCGAQYHPECPANAISKSLRKCCGIFSVIETLIYDLEVADSYTEAVERLGATCDALQHEKRTLELANLLIHVKDRISS